MEAHRQQFNALVTRLEAYQVSCGLNDGKFAARYSRYVGSPKTWVDRLKSRNYEEIGDALPRWSSKLSALLDELDGTGTIEIARLPIVRYAELLWERLQGQTNDRRNGMLIGIQGTGRTIALRHLQRNHPTDAVFLSANETWKDSRMEIACGLARAIGKSPLPSAAATFGMVISELKFTPITILIDEAHEGGVLLLKLVKTLINETRCRSILSLYTTSWHRLLSGSNESYAEAQQLLRRTIRPVLRAWETGVQKSDVAAFLSEKLGSAKLDALASDLWPLVRTSGGFSLLDDAIDLAEINSDSTSKKLTREALLSAVRELIGREATKQEEA